MSGFLLLKPPMEEPLDTSWTCNSHSTRTNERQLFGAQPTNPVVRKLYSYILLSVTTYFQLYAAYNPPFEEWTRTVLVANASDSARSSPGGVV